jgi:hypothetical protein
MSLMKICLLMMTHPFLLARERSGALDAPVRRHRDECRRAEATGAIGLHRSSPRDARRLRRRHRTRSSYASWSRKSCASRRAARCACAFTIVLRPQPQLGTFDMLVDAGLSWTPNLARSLQAIDGRLEHFWLTHPHEDLDGRSCNAAKSIEYRQGS